jgi:GR25 family glycosyltransferase involved in LPS biosynthesis
MSNKQNYKIYVINLNERVDKLAFISNQFNNSNFNFERISACRYDDLKIFQNQNHLTPAKVQANWNSHLLAYQKLVNSSDKFCLILEDDCEISNEGFKALRLINEVNSFNFDILQIGFLELENKLKYKSILTSKIEVHLMKKIKEVIMKVKLFAGQKKIIAYINKKINILEYQLDQSTKIELSKMIVPEFLSGTHAYLIHREMAEKLLRYNEPIVFGADLAIQVLALSGNWRIYRTPVSLASQADLGVDITNHRKFQYDLGEEILKELSHENIH